VPHELIVNSVLRARFCEQVAARSRLRTRSNDLFLLGLFSMIDALLRRPLPELVAVLPLDEDVKRTLLGQPSELEPVYSLVRAYEQADWPSVGTYQATLGIDEADVVQAYHAALEWVATFSHLTSAEKARTPKAATRPPAANAGATGHGSRLAQRCIAAQSVGLRPTPGIVRSARSVKRAPRRCAWTCRGRTGAPARRSPTPPASCWR
jgi:hypothetical protein